MHMGQDQEAGVADDPLEVPGAGGIVPADPLIAPLQAPGGRRELQAAQDQGAWGCGLDQVADMGAKGHAMAEIMMALDERAPQVPLGLCCHALKADGLKPVERVAQGCGRRIRTGGYGGHGAARTTGLQRGQRNQPRLLHPFKERPALDRLRLSVGAVPIEEFAHRSAELMAA